MNVFTINQRLAPLCFPWLLLCVATLARAADDPLSFEEALALALTNAPQLAAQQAAVEGAHALTLSAGRLPDPELVAGVENLPTNGADAWSLGNDFMTMRKIGVMQSFPNVRKRQAERDMAQAQLAVADSTATETRLAISQAVVEAWITGYTDDMALKSMLQLSPELALQMDAARAAFAHGRASASDALAAQAAVADLDDRILEATRSVAVARAELFRWIGEAGERPFGTAPTLNELPVGAESLATHPHHHAALLTYDAKIVAARSEIERAEADKRPDWSTEVSYAKRGPGFSNLVSVEFRLQLPLFPGERQDPAISAKHAALTQLQSERDAELNMHVAEIKTALAAWHSARDRIDLYERERLPLARQRSELALAAFQAGHAGLRETLATHAEEIELQHSYAELVQMLGRAWVSLRYLQPEGHSP